MIRLFNEFNCNLAADRNLNHLDEFGKTSLHIAVADNSVDKVLNLLQKGVSASTADETGETPLHAATRNGNYAIAEVNYGGSIVTVT